MDHMASFCCALVAAVLLAAACAEGRSFEEFKRDFDPLHRECGIVSEEREGCGRKADRASELECQARGCCYEEDPQGDSPGCFLPKRMLGAECNVDYKEKDDCGHWGITEGECIMRGCCYRPSERTNDPYCFFKKKDSIRLVGGENDAQGRVEIQHEGEWGTVCDDGFGREEAKVICKSLGYESGTPHIEASFGEGSGDIWMDSLECIGNEANLADCDHQGWGSHDCSHSEDAGVTCSNGSYEEEDDEDEDEYEEDYYNEDADDGDYDEDDYDYYNENENDDDDSDEEGPSGYDEYYWNYRSFQKPQ